ncbi:hypothetical protein L0F63_006456, partial [Massospora cicadina]
GMTVGDEVDSSIGCSENEFNLEAMGYDHTPAFRTFEPGEEYKLYLTEDGGHAKWRIKDKKKDTKYMVYYDDGHATLMAPNQRIAHFPIEEELGTLDVNTDIQTVGEVAYSLEARNVARWEMTVHDEIKFRVFSLTRHQKGWDVTLGPLGGGTHVAKFRPRVGETKLGIFTFLVHLEPLVAQCLLLALCHAITVANARYRMLTGEQPYLEHDQYFKYFDLTPQVTH